MFLIYCPHCEEQREEDEFHASGQAHLARPADPDACSDKEWGEFLYFRKNPRGLHRELWQHTAGCRKYFNIARDTVTYEIHGSYKVGETYEPTFQSHTSEQPGSEQRDFKHHGSEQPSDDTAS